MPDARRYLIFAPGSFVTNGKTAQGVMRYASDQVVAIVDPRLVGRNARDVLSHLRRDAPIVASVAEGLAYGPTALLLGTAPMGGQLPLEWRAEILAAIRAGLNVVSGLHDFLAEDPEFSVYARTYGTEIVDVRKAPDAIPIFSGNVYDVAAPILLTVGNECAVGKMTVSLEIAAAARTAGKNAVFVPTGQTGIMIAGWGVAIDRVVADFAAGAAEQLVLQAARSEPDLIIVEGQGAINHPAYAAVTTALLYGCAPDALLLVCNPSLKAIEPYGTPVLSYRDLISMYEAACAAVKPAHVVGVAVNTSGLSEDDAACAVEEARQQTGLPADDVVRHGSASLYASIAENVKKRAPLRRTSLHVPSY